MRPERRLGGESLSANVAVKRSVLESLDLRLVVAQVLLQVGQLDEGAAAVRDVAAVRTLT